MKERLYFIIALLIMIVPGIVFGADLFNANNVFKIASDDGSLRTMSANINQNKYPKLANLFYRWHIEKSEVTDLAKFDILVFDMEVQTYSPDRLKEIRQLNPNVKILVYLASQEIRGDSGTLTGTLRQRLYQQIDPSWWLVDNTGKSIAWWAPNPIVNITSLTSMVNNKRWAQVLPEFVKTQLIDTGYWDGVFYDNVWDSVSFLDKFNIDLNRDGIKDSIIDVNNSWRIGMTDILNYTRQLLGDNKIIFGNGGEYFASHLNGVLYESFQNRNWADILNRYKYINHNGFYPAAGIINTNVNNSGNKNDFRAMRYGLASVLMDNGYNSFDNGDQTHHEIWWYDEYEAYLGAPAGDPVNLANAKSSSFAEGVWRRDFKNGLVLVNSTSKQYTVDLQGEYEKLQGIQDTITNDGSFVTEVTLAPKDGLILRRPIEKIQNASFINGSFARLFNKFGHRIGSGFFAYNEKYRGSLKMMETDLNNDEQMEVIVASESDVKIYDSLGQQLASFYPYTEKYRSGINFAVGDINGDGLNEIVTGTERGGGPQIRIFNWQGHLINTGFFAYAKNFRGGVSVALGDIDGNGRLEIIAGAGFGGGPHVRIFSTDGQLINPGFFAYDTKFRGGVNVATGDVNGDGKSEIITGAGNGGTAEVKIFNKKGEQINSFTAFDNKVIGGLNVASTDMDDDGLSEIIATTSDVFTVSGF